MQFVEPFVFSDAVAEFWRTRERQTTEQRQRGGADQGMRSAVTGGQQMNGFVRTITDLMIVAGISSNDIYTRRAATDLPGFYRPTKGWDLVVVVSGQLLAAIEFKSQVGPSFGNNFNNRTEEAMGSALDIWTAYREGAFRLSPAPWLGYLLLLEDCEDSRTPVRVHEPHFAVFPEFRDASYAIRYEVFCRTLVRERQYTASCFLMAQRRSAALRENYIEPAADLSATVFLSQLLRHVSSL